MARSNRQLVPKAHKALDDMKYELAAEFNLPVYQGSEDYWGNLTSRDCGRVGGNMVRRMIMLAEEAMAEAKSQAEMKSHIVSQIAQPIAQTEQTALAPIEAVIASEASARVAEQVAQNLVH